MTTLLLIRHSESQPLPGVPARDWPLTPAGEARVAALARRMAPFRPNRLLTSTEPKAIHTGTLLADALGLPTPQADPAFDEHDRRDVPWFDSAEQFHAAVARFFAHPDTLVFGGETAHAAHKRFAAGVDAHLRRQPHDTVAIITHGTVMALYSAAAFGRAPVDLWGTIQAIGMPALISLRWPELCHGSVIG